MLTKNGLAKETDIPISTLKYYMEKFSEYFEPQYVDGVKYPKYKQECVDIALLIRELMGKQQNTAQIRKALEEKDYLPVYEIVETSRRLDNQESSMVDLSIIPTLEASTNAVTILNRMNEELTKLLKKQEAEIQDYKDTIDELKNQIQEQKKTIEDLQSKQTKKRGK